MILEGLLATIDEDGGPHLSAIGPEVDAQISRIELRPFAGSRTFENLRRVGQAVFHVTDDVELIAAVVSGQPLAAAAWQQATKINGFVWTDACRAYELIVAYQDLRPSRAVMACQIDYVHRFRDFFGFNRAKHAVVEAAILATRLGFLPQSEVEQQWARLRPIVDKTGGDAEQRAFTTLTAFVDSHLGLNAR
jgi:hypothetical protein